MTTRLYAVLIALALFVVALIFAWATINSPTIRDNCEHFTDQRSDLTNC